MPKTVNLQEEYNKSQDVEAPPTTLMIRNIPNHFTQKQLIGELENLGFAGDAAAPACRVLLAAGSAGDRSLWAQGAVAAKAPPLRQVGIVVVLTVVGGGRTPPRKERVRPRFIDALEGCKTPSANNPSPRRRLASQGAGMGKTMTLGEGPPTLLHPPHPLARWGKCGDAGRRLMAARLLQPPRQAMHSSSWCPMSPVLS